VRGFLPNLDLVWAHNQDPALPLLNLPCQLLGCIGRGGRAENSASSYDAVEGGGCSGLARATNNNHIFIGAVGADRKRVAEEVSNAFGKGTQCLLGEKYIRVGRQDMKGCVFFGNAVLRVSILLAEEYAEIL
jgi:hypothetical protein